MITAIEHSGMKITNDAIKSKKWAEITVLPNGIYRHKKQWSQHKKNDKPVDKNGG